MFSNKLQSKEPYPKDRQGVYVFFLWLMCKKKQHFIAPFVCKWSVPCNCFMDKIFLFLMLDSNIEPVIWETFSALDVYVCFFLISWMSH